MSADFSFVQQKIVKLLVPNASLTRKEIVEQLDLHPVIVWKELECLVRSGFLEKQRSHNGTNAFVYTLKEGNSSLEAKILTLVAALPWLSNQEIAKQMDNRTTDVYQCLQVLCSNGKIKKRHRQDGTIEYASMGVSKNAGKHPRIQIVELLAAHTWLCYRDIAEKLGFHPKTLSEHLGLLVKAKLVEKKKIGTKVYYALPGATESVWNQFDTQREELHTQTTKKRVAPVRSPSPIPSKILKLLEETPWMDKTEIAEKIGCEVRTVHVHLKKLKEVKSRKRYRSGNNRRTEYALINIPDDSVLSLSPISEKILGVLEETPWLDRTTIVEKIGYGQTTVRIHLNKLEETRKVKRRKGYGVGNRMRFTYALIDALDDPVRLTDEQEAVLSELKLQAWQTSAEIATKTGLPKYKVHRDLEKLEQVGEVKHKQGYNGRNYCYYYALVGTPDDGVPNLPKKPSSTTARLTQNDKMTLLWALEKRPFLTAEQLAEQVNWPLRRTKKPFQMLQEHDLLVAIQLADKTVYCTHNQRCLLCLLYRARTWVPVKFVGIALPVLQHWSQPEVGYVVLANRRNNQYVQIIPKGIAHAIELEKKIDPTTLPSVRKFFS